MGIIVGARVLFVVLSVLGVFSLCLLTISILDLKSQVPLVTFITPAQENEIKKIEGVVSYTKVKKMSFVHL
jgi:lipoprotein-releasing system permease protein